MAAKMEGRKVVAVLCRTVMLLALCALIGCGGGASSPGSASSDPPPAPAPPPSPAPTPSSVPSTTSQYGQWFTLPYTMPTPSPSVFRSTRGCICCPAGKFSIRLHLPPLWCSIPASKPGHSLPGRSMAARWRSGPTVPPCCCRSRPPGGSMKTASKFTSLRTCLTRMAVRPHGQSQAALPHPSLTAALQRSDREHGYRLDHAHEGGVRNSLLRHGSAFRRVDLQRGKRRLLGDGSE